MKKLICNLPAKITAIILSFVTVAVSVLSIIAVVYMLDNGYYTSSRTDIKDSVIENRIGYEAISRMHEMYNGDDLEGIDSFARYKGIYYTVEYSYGKGVIISNYDGQEYYSKVTEQNLEHYIYYEQEIDDNTTVTSTKNDHNIDITVYIPESKELSNGTKTLLKLSDLLFLNRYRIIILGILSVVLSIAVLCFLYASVGHGADGTVKCNYFDKIPFDILTVVMLSAALINVEISENIYGGLVTMVIITVITLTADYFLALSYTLSFATRLKTKTLVKNNVIYIILKLIGKYLKRIFNWFKNFFKNLPLVPKTLAICGMGLAYLLFSLLIGALFDSEAMFVFLAFLLFPIIFVAVIFAAITLKKIKIGGEKIASGDLTYKIDTTNMHGDFKDFAKSLNNINNGLSVAINEKMKSERFKTELITNVSHDIKTPLTSIINYVDLIKKEDIQNEDLKTYIDVLDRQSVRLKKLIEDLVEASKASTGNLAVNLSECEVGVLLSQTVGEFDEKLGAAGLSAVLKQPETPIKIMADGRHLWRVFDNLMNNVCKYSLKGTRVYMDVFNKDNKAIITFRNISAFELNISGEELMERFVRGDKSRNTEGSGLGLAIAKSLTELQNGKLDIFVDGDLFKVVLTFDIIQ